MTTRSLISAADREGVRLRLLGSLAFRFHCPRYVDYLDAMERELTDIDFAASGKERRDLRKFFGGLAYYWFVQRHKTGTLASHASAGGGRPAEAGGVPVGGPAPASAE